MNISLSHQEFGDINKKFFPFLTIGILLSDFSKFPPFIALKINIGANFAPSSAQEF